MAERQSRLTWRVHESTARALCQFAFLALGLLPLGVCLLWSAQQFLPTYQKNQAQRWERLLSSQLGLLVRVAAYESRAPERFALHEIRLVHPETGVVIGRVRLAEVQWSDGKWSIRLTQPELEGDELATVWKIVHDWCLCRPQAYAHSVRVGMSELTIHQASGPSVLNDVALTLLPNAEASLLNVQFRLGGGSAATAATHASSQPKPAQIIIRRDHRSDQLKTEIQLRSGACEVPCSLVSSILPSVRRLGENARFSGTIDIDQRRDAWRSMITDGRVTGIDWSLLTAETEALLSGTGQLHMEQLVVNHAGLELVRGSGVIEGGKMAHALFTSLGHLGIALRNINPVSSYSFDKLEFAMDIRQPNLHLRCVMVDAHGVLAVRERGDEALPLESVVNALSACASVDRSASLAAPADTSLLPSNGLARQAMLWLPLHGQPWEAAERSLRLSSNESPVINE